MHHLCSERKSGVLNMRKIISNKVYDTERAKELGRWQNSEDPRDFGWVSETLYRKKNGEYFIHGEGGPATSYAARSFGDNWTSGERIIPMTYDVAAEWAQKNLQAEEYEKIFGAVQDDMVHRYVTYWLTTSAAEKLRRKADQEGVQVSEMLERMINHL